MQYLGFADSIRDNGLRHVEKGRWWLEHGYLDRARGSFLKAERNFKAAESLYLDLGLPAGMEFDLRRLSDILEREVERSIMDGVFYGKVS